MLLSNGELVLSDTTPTFARTTYYPSTGLSLTRLFASYGQIYRKQLWVYVVVRKRALGTARLPLKVFERLDDDSRQEARDTPYSKLLQNPNPKHDANFFWLWTSSTFDIYGEALWLKVRGRNRQPAELWPVHPSNISTRLIDGDLFYVYLGGSSSTEPLLIIPAADVVHFKTYNPDSTVRGLSPLEPLRESLINEDAARRASSAFWANGARPATYLSHPKKLSTEARDRLRADWNEIHGGVDNFAKTAILEEGMEPKIVSLSAEESQYINSRKLNREEACGVYDTPPPVVHILDHATFSNITEQMRSMYRDTMAPHLGGFEATMDQQLRPDFVDDSSQYAEFVMDQVLRGDYETRMEANQKAIGSAQMTPNESRKLENRPPIKGGDKLYINSTLIPIDQVSSRTSPNPPAEDIAGSTPAVEEAPTTAPKLIPKRTPSDQVPAGKGLTKKELRDVMGRLGQARSLEDVDLSVLVAGLNGGTDAVVTAAIGARSLDDLRDRLRAAAKEEA